MTTTFTALKVTAEGVLLFAAHRRRLCGADPELRARFDAWAGSAPPGVYAIVAREGVLEIESRPGSKLFDGIAVRFQRSPFAGLRGAFPKPPPPSPYLAVRAPGIATLLTDEAGVELYESCAASVFAWDGATLVGVREDAPRVASVAEACLVGALPHRRAPILVESAWPLALVNAVAGVCEPAAPGRSAFPASVRRAMESALASTARRAP